MIYIASKTKHAKRWLKLKESGYPIISTWIHEAEAGQTEDFNDLWTRCINECMAAKVLVIYREPEELFKGAWVELGAALASRTKVYAVGLEGFTISRYQEIFHCDTIMEAMDMAAREAYT